MAARHPETLRPFLVLGLLAATGASAGEAPVTAGTLIRTTRSPRTVTITFVHRVRNLSPGALEEVTAAVAVPRSDDRQTIHSIRFEPKPEEVTADGWGQETAHFRLGSIPVAGEAEVRCEASVTLRDASWRVTERDIGDQSEIPSRVVGHYLRNGENYRIDHEALDEAAAKLALDGHGPLERLRRIHDFVMDSLQYDLDDRWDSAESVLRSGKGSCSEYTYLMIALCRRHGIPARYAGGSALLQAGPTGPPRAGNETGIALEPIDRVFHRWVEVYLPRVGWFPVDPTRDDDASVAGDPYRFFGHVPWFHFTMFRGDGDPLESGRLGWEYRSTMRWKDERATPPGTVIIDRSAVWDGVDEADQAPAVAAQR